MDESTANQSSVKEDKLEAIETFIEEYERELKAKKANLGLSVPVKQYLLKAAMYESRLEGQIYELRNENKRLLQQVEMAQVQISRHDLDSAESLQLSRLEGQIDIFKDENNKLSVEVETLKLDNFSLKMENKNLKEQVELLRTGSQQEADAKLQAELKTIREEIRATQNQTSYAMIASTPVSNKQPTAVETRLQRAKEKQTNVLFFKSTEKKGSKEVKEVITKIINPREDKVKIKAIRTTPNTVIVETATRADAAKIAEKTATLTNITCEETRKRRPMVIVYQVPTSITDNDFLEQLHQINLSDTLTKEDFKKEVALKFKTGRKDSNKANNVLEVSPRIWCTLVKNERIYIDFESLRVRDFTRVSRCYTCHDLGHSTKQCRLKEPVCYKCAKTGHLQAACKEKEIGCIPCMYRKRTCNKAGGPECPTHKQLLDKLLNNTDYGQ